MSQENTRVVLLVILTGVTGSVDAASYLGTGHVFTANMTGNVALLGLAAGGADLPLLRPALAFAAFMMGTVLGGRLMGRRAGSGTTWPARVLVGQLVSLLFLGTAALVWLRPHPSEDVLAALLALAMGLQGATVRALGVADLPTTVVTSTLTGLGADSRLAGGSSTRWRRRLAAVAALLLGALLGAALFHLAESLALLPAVAADVTVFLIVVPSRLHLVSSD